MSLFPYEYTVDAAEPEAWAFHLEATRDALVELGGYTEHDINKELARELASLRAGAAENERIRVAQAEAYLGLNGSASTNTTDVAERKTATLDIETWADFRDNSPTEIDYLVTGLVPQGSLVFLAGAPKAGKTWLSIALSCAVATGKPFLGRFIVPQAEPVIYLALEGHRTAIRARIGAIARGLGADPDTEDLRKLAISYRPVGLDLSDPAWALEVSEHVTLQGAKLVVVDVLRAAAPRLRESGEGAGDFGQIRALLAPLLAQGVTICLLHHFIKVGDTSKARGIGERMAGSGALFGHADLVLGITGKDPRAMRIELVSRDGAAPDPFGVNLDGHGSTEFGGFGYQDTLRVIAVDDAPAEGGAWDQAKPISEWLQSHGRPVSPKEIRDQFDVPDQTLRDHRGDLEKLGIVYRSAGRLSTYQATPRTPREPPSGGWHSDPTNPTAPYRGRGVGGESESTIEDLSQLESEWEDL